MQLVTFSYYFRLKNKNKNMKKLILVLFLFLSINLEIQSQNLIGLSKKEVTNYILQEYPNENLTPDWNKTETGYDYVSFERESSTLAYYFTTSEICYSYLVVYPYSKMNGAIEYLNSKFTVYQNEIWIDYNEVADYKYSIQRKEGFFIISCVIYKTH